MTILGIDPGYERCGFAVIQKTGKGVSLLNYGIIKTKATSEFAWRQDEIAQDFQQLVDKYKPTVLSIEDLFFVQNITTGLKVAQVRGVLTYLGHRAGCRIVEPKPTEVKKFFCGDGKADKAAMKKMAQMTFNLTNQPKIDDAADAIAVAYFAASQVDFMA